MKLIRWQGMVVMCIYVGGWLPLFILPVQLGQYDKALHFVAFFGFSLILLLTLKVHQYLVTFTCILVAAIGTELVQPFFGRRFDWLDVVMNLSGGLSAIAVAYCISHKRQLRSTES